jgi:hypothetical protein
MSPPRKVIVDNHTAKPFGLVIEPVAIYERINPGQVAEIVMDGDYERPMEVTLTDEGDVFIGVWEDVTFSVDGRVILDMRT